MGPAEGANIAYVWVKDGATNVSSATVQSNTLTWDGTAPTWNNSVAIVFTSPETSGWKHQGATLDVNYTANAVDLVPVTGVPGSGLNRYDYALGTGASGNAASNIIAWTSLNLPTGAQTIPLTGLSLVEGVTYYFSVRAVDNYDNKQTYTKSFQVDLTDPGAPTIDSPAENQTIVLSSNPPPATSYSGSCDVSAVSNTTTFTAGAGVTLSGSSCDSSGTLATNAIFSFNSSNRSVTVTTTKSSGRFSTMTRTIVTQSMPILVSSADTANNRCSNPCIPKTFTMPPGIMAGDLLIMKYNTGYTPPPGWTALYAGSGMAWKVAVGTENGAPQTLTTPLGRDKSGGTTYRFVGNSTTLPINTYAINHQTYKFSNCTSCGNSINGQSVHISGVPSPAAVVGDFILGANITIVYGPSDFQISVAQVASSAGVSISSTTSTALSVTPTVPVSLHFVILESITTVNDASYNLFSAGVYTKPLLVQSATGDIVGARSSGITGYTYSIVIK